MVDPPGAFDQEERHGRHWGGHTMGGHSHGPDTVALNQGIVSRVDRLRADLDRLIATLGSRITRAVCEYEDIHRAINRAHPDVDEVTEAYGLDHVYDQFAELTPGV